MLCLWQHLVLQRLGQHRYRSLLLVNQLQLVSKHPQDRILHFHPPLTRRPFNLPHQLSVMDFLRPRKLLLFRFPIPPTVQPFKIIQNHPHFRFLPTNFLTCSPPQLRYPLLSLLQRGEALLLAPPPVAFPRALVNWALEYL